MLIKYKIQNFVFKQPLLGTLRFTERQRDGNVLRQTVN